MTEIDLTGEAAAESWARLSRPDPRSNRWLVTKGVKSVWARCNSKVPLKGSKHFCVLSFPLESPLFHSPDKVKWLKDRGTCDPARYVGLEVQKGMVDPSMLCRFLC